MSLKNTLIKAVVTAMIPFNFQLTFPVTWMVSDDLTTALDSNLKIYSVLFLKWIKWAADPCITDKSTRKTRHRLKKDDLIMINVGQINFSPYLWKNITHIIQHILIMLMDTCWICYDSKVHYVYFVNVHKLLPWQDRPS